MEGISWVQVLEIETYLHKLVESNPENIIWGVWEVGMKNSMILNKNQSYKPDDIREYLFKKYPHNELIRNKPQIIESFCEILLNGGKLTKVDELLYQMNSNPKSFQATELEQSGKNGQIDHPAPV